MKVDAPVTESEPAMVALPVEEAIENLLVPEESRIDTPSIDALNCVTPVKFFKVKEPDPTTSPPNIVRLVLSLEPETKKTTSVPGDAGNVAAGLLAIMTEPEIPIAELDWVLPDM